MVTSRRRSDLPKDAASGKRFGIIVSRYHDEITTELLRGAQSTLENLGAKKGDIFSVWVPGAFEIPLAARTMAAQEFDAIICLGVVVKGETTHDEYVAREVARGISAVAQASGRPVIFGVLTVQTLEQAKARAGGEKGHKGVEAAEAAVDMLRVIDQIEKAGDRPSKSVGFSGNIG